MPFSDSVRTTEAVFYGIACTLVLLQIALLSRTIILLRSVPAIAKFGPFNSSLILLFAWFMLCIFTVSSILPEVSIGLFLQVFVPVCGVFIGLAINGFVAIYIQFFETERRVDIAVHIINSGGAGGTVFKEFHAERILKSVTATFQRKTGLVLAHAFFTCIPFYFHIYFGDQQFFAKSFNSNDFSISNLIVSINVVIVGLWPTVLYVWLYVKLRRKRNDKQVAALMGSIAAAIAYSGICIFAVYNSPKLLNWSFEYFDFKPFLLYMLPIEGIVVLYAFHTWRIKKRVKKIPFRNLRSGEISMTSSGGSRHSTRDELEFLLNDPKGNDMMLEAAREEFNVENILFWNAVKHWKSLKSSEGKSAVAKQIIDLFIIEGSGCELNLPDRMRSEITNRFEESGDSILVPVNLFDEAVRQVSTLMMWQTFMTLKTQKKYQEFVKAASAEKTSLRSNSALRLLTT